MGAGGSHSARLCCFGWSSSAPWSLHNPGSEGFCLPNIGWFPNLCWLGKKKKKIPSHTKKVCDRIFFFSSPIQKKNLIFATKLVKKNSKKNTRLQIRPCEDGRGVTYVQLYIKIKLRNYRVNPWRSLIIYMVPYLSIMMIFLTFTCCQHGMSSSVSYSPFYIYMLYIKTSVLPRHRHVIYFRVNVIYFKTRVLKYNNITFTFDVKYIGVNHL